MRSKLFSPIVKVLQKKINALAGKKIFKQLIKTLFPDIYIYRVGWGGRERERESLYIRNLDYLLPNISIPVCLKA